MGGFLKSCTATLLATAIVLVLCATSVQACPVSTDNPLLPKTPLKSASAASQSLFAPTASPADDRNASYDMRVLVVTYYPFNRNGKLIDKTFDKLTAPNFLEAMQYSVEEQVTAAVAGIERASRYRGYADPSAEPALRYSVVKRVSRFQKLPWTTLTPQDSLGPIKYLNYKAIVERENICDLVDNQGVNEVWLFKAQSKDGHAQMESKMSGPHGDISNSTGWSKGDLPVCSKTYRVYTHDLGRHDLFLEVWSHQLEHELQYVANFQVGGYALLRNWFGPCEGDSNYSCYPAKIGRVARCGNAHNPPNARNEYDRENRETNMSDCLDWNPDGMGRLSPISCETWGCGANDIFDNSTLNYSVWLWQNMPGRNNDKTYQGYRLRNWWAVHGDWDNFVASRAGLVVDGVPLGPLTPPPAPAYPRVKTKGKVTTVKMQALRFVKYEVQLVHNSNGESRFTDQQKPTIKYRNLSKGSWRIRYRFIEEATGMASKYSSWVYFDLK